MSCNQGHLTHPEHWPGDCGDLLGIASPAPGNHYVMLRFDYLAEDESDALRIGRDIVGHLNWRTPGPGRSQAPAAPAYDSEELLGIASPAPGNHYVMLRFVATVMAATALGVSADSVNAVLRDLFEVEG